MSVTVKLKTPIHVLGEMVGELTLREPRGKDIAICGIPQAFVRRGNTVRIDVDAAVVHDYIGELAGIPASSVDQLSAADWITAQAAVLNFFLTAGEDGAEAAGKEDVPPAQETTKGIRFPFQDSSTQPSS